MSRIRKACQKVISFKPNTSGIVMFHNQQKIAVPIAIKIGRRMIMIMLNGKADSFSFVLCQSSNVSLCSPPQADEH